MKSAVLLLVANGTLYREASLTSPITSFWCPCIMRLSQKKTSISTLYSAIIALICASPPSGPLRSFVISGHWSPSSSFRASSISLPVVPVQKSLQDFSDPALKRTQLTSSVFLASWATRAMFFIISVCNLMSFISSVRHNADRNDAIIRKISLFYLFLRPQNWKT